MLNKYYDKLRESNTSKSIYFKVDLRNTYDYN